MGASSDFSPEIDFFCSNHTCYPWGWAGGTGVESTVNYQVDLETALLYAEFPDSEFVFPLVLALPSWLPLWLRVMVSQLLSVLAVGLVIFGWVWVHERLPRAGRTVKAWFLQLREPIRKITTPHILTLHKFRRRLYRRWRSWSSRRASDCESSDAADAILVRNLAGDIMEYDLFGGVFVSDFHRLYGIILFLGPMCLPEEVSLVWILDQFGLDVVFEGFDTEVEYPTPHRLTIVRDGQLLSYGSEEDEMMLFIDGEDGYLPLPKDIAEFQPGLWIDHTHVDNSLQEEGQQGLRRQLEHRLCLEELRMVKSIRGVVTGNHDKRYIVCLNLGLYDEKAAFRALNAVARCQPNIDRLDLRNDGISNWLVRKGFPWGFRKEAVSEGQCHLRFLYTALSLFPNVRTLGLWASDESVPQDRPSLALFLARAMKAGNMPPDLQARLDSLVIPVGDTYPLIFAECIHLLSQVDLHCIEFSERQHLRSGPQRQGIAVELSAMISGSIATCRCPHFVFCRSLVSFHADCVEAGVGQEAANLLARAIIANRNLRVVALEVMSSQLRNAFLAALRRLGQNERRNLKILYGAPTQNVNGEVLDLSPLIKMARKHDIIVTTPTSLRLLMSSLCTRTAIGKQILVVFSLVAICVPSLLLGRFLGNISPRFFASDEIHRGKLIGAMLLFYLVSNMWNIKIFKMDSNAMGFLFSLFCGLLALCRFVPLPAGLLCAWLLVQRYKKPVWNCLDKLVPKYLDILFPYAHLNASEWPRAQ